MALRLLLRPRPHLARRRSVPTRPRAATASHLLTLALPHLVQEGPHPAQEGLERGAAGGRCRRCHYEGWRLPAAATMMSSSFPSRVAHFLWWHRMNLPSGTAAVGWLCQVSECCDRNGVGYKWPQALPTVPARSTVASVSCQQPHAEARRARSAGAEAHLDGRLTSSSLLCQVTDRRTHCQTLPVAPAVALRCATEHCRGREPRRAHRRVAQRRHARGFSNWARQV